MTAISKLLIANRGEIACRIIKTARGKGYRTVAVYSEADADALHVRLADEAVLIGPPTVSQSYLSIERIIAAARRSGADAIHPGYGFLSERAAFAVACAEAGINFVGPGVDAIRLMGDKAESKKRMIEAGVPCVPGYQGDDQADEVFVREAARIGYPVMIKASAGGGGRGMRLVHKSEALTGALRSARSEALTAFGDDRLLMELAVTDARHVEIQVFGDQHGNVIHLGERDCSVQRRHQKVFEEAPSPAVDAALRERMGAAAVRAAAAIGYVGAGTVEFLLSPKGEFYFLEMNTRLQVEHPVTEMVTGLDLVALQLDIAEGKPLPLRQEHVQLNGHAIEARLYAEDPANDFLPQTGDVVVWEPAQGEGVRVDHGLQAGSAISAFYDPMIAKVIAWGADRHEARRRLLRAIEDTRIVGVSTNRAFLAATLRNADFAAGAATTAFIGRHFPSGFHQPEAPSWAAPLAAALLADRGHGGWRSNRWSAYPVKLRGPAGVDSVWLATREGADWNLSSGVETISLRIVERCEYELRVLIDGRILKLGAHLRLDSDAPLVELDQHGATWRYEDRTLAPPELAEDSGSHGSLRAPMNGLVTWVGVTEGESVTRGQLLLVLEAMKMEHQIVAPRAGIVSTLAALKGAQVATRDVLLIVSAEANE
jgi:geranyl-CoA carboxylase alpha subunit